MSAAICGVGHYVPPNSLSNDVLSKSLNTSDNWIYSHTGIRNRYIASSDQSTADLAYYAAKDAIKVADIDEKSINFIICATSTPDYLSFPSTACILQDMLDASNAAAFDISAACSGFIYGLEISRSIIEANSSNNVLLVCSEIFSRIINWQDRQTCILFGDGAGAVIVSDMRNNASSSRIIGSILRAQGADHATLIRDIGGARYPERQEGKDSFLKMNGRKVYTFAITAIINAIEQILHSYKIDFEEVDFVVPHQANRRMIEAVCKKKNWDINRFFINIDQYANTSAASIPICLFEMQNKGLLQRGQKIITVGFGAGLTYGANYIIW